MKLLLLLGWEDDSDNDILKLYSLNSNNADISLESVEDIYNKSELRSTQKSMIEDYCYEHNLDIKDVEVKYVDVSHYDLRASYPTYEVALSYFDGKLLNLSGPKSVKYKVELEGDLLIRQTTISFNKLGDSDMIPFIEKTIKKRFGKNLSYEFNHFNRYVKINSGIRKKTFIINGKPIDLYVGSD